MKFFTRTQDGWKNLTWAGAYAVKLRAGMKELGGARELMRVVRGDWIIWTLIIWGLVFHSFGPVALAAVAAASGAAVREWTLRSYTRLIEGYGTIVDQQQGIINSYQTERMHPNGGSAKAHTARMN